MIKRLLAIAVVCIISMNVTAGKFQIGFSAGYGFGACKNYVGAYYNYNIGDGYTEWKDIYATMGNGIKIDIDGAYQINKNISIIVAAGFSMLGGYESKWEYFDSVIAATVYEKRIGNLLPITAGIKFNTEIRKMIPYLSLSPGIFFPVGVHGEDEYRGWINSKYDISWKFAPGFYISSCIGAIYYISNLLGIKIEVAPSYGVARLKESIEEDQDGYKMTTIYLKNEEDLPENTNNKTYQHGGPTYSFSSISAKVGVVLSF